MCHMKVMRAAAILIMATAGCGSSGTCPRSVPRVGDSGSVRLVVAKNHDGLTTTFADRDWFLRIPSPRVASGNATVVKESRGGAVVLDVETKDGRGLLLSQVIACD